MNYIMIPFLFAILIYNHYREKNSYNPVFVLCSIWLLVTILCTINYYELNSVSDKSYALALLGIICFCLGVTFRNKHKFVLTINDKTKSENASDLKYVFLIILYLFILLFTTYFAMRSIMALRRGVSMETIRFYYKDYKYGLILTTGWQYDIEHYIVATSEFAAVVLLPIVITDRKSKEKRILLFELVLFLVLHMLVTGARSFIIEVAIVLFYYFLMNKSLRSYFSEQFKKIPKFVFVILFIGAISAVVLMTQLRKGDKSIFKEIYNYFAISFPLLDIHLDLMAENPDFTYGMTMLNGLLRPFLVLLKKFGIPYPSLYQKAVDLIGANDTFYAVGKGRANSFVTMFYYFYMDFGILSVILGCFFYGYLSQSVYICLKRNPCNRNQAFYLLIALGLFLSFTRLQFTAHRYLYAFLILLLSFKRSNTNADL